MLQGSSLSPVLSNILLNEPDRKPENVGVKYIRYADGFSLYCTEESEVRRAGNEVCLYLRDMLHLPVNRGKSGICRPADFTIPGYGFETYRPEASLVQYHPVAGAKRLKIFKQKLRELTCKATSYTFDTHIWKPKKVHRGRLQYFRSGRIYRQPMIPDRWLRSRLRYCIRHNRKRAGRTSFVPA
jgi:hypothetical protein